MGTQNFFLSHARDKTKKNFFIYFFSGLEIQPSFLFYLLPCGYFPNKSKGLCIRCFMKKKPNFLLLEGDVSKEILVLRRWESIAG